MTSLDAIVEALQSAQVAWTGCDWDTEFGPQQLNLRGLTSRQAHLAAQATRGDESACWQEACQFLDKIERDAKAAAELASEAVDCWRRGDKVDAGRRIKQAVALESAYRTPIAYRKLAVLMHPIEPSTTS